VFSSARAPHVAARSGISVHVRARACGRGWVGGFVRVRASKLAIARHMCNGRLFAEMPPSLMKALATQNITYNLHSAGVTPGKHLKLEEAVSVLATSVDRGGRPFVAAMEHRSLPIYGTQFHPEKPEFVPNTARTHIPKTHNAKAVGSLLGEFFVNATRSAIAVAAYN
jgi:hypothetical protein